MEFKGIWQAVKNAYIRYDRMMEKQGFYVVLGVCVTVIVVSAVFTFRMRDEEAVLPEGLSFEEAAEAGGSQNAQTLLEAQALVASQNAAFSVPTEAPFRLIQPLNGFTDRTFSDTEPQFFPQSDAWRVHTGLDILAEYGAPVVASAKGRVAEVGQDNELGLTVRIDHENGYQTLYAGLSAAAYVREGDPVAQGQTIGHAGNGVLHESDGQPHLHFEVHKNGKPMDPLAAFLGLDK